MFKDRTGALPAESSSAHVRSRDEKHFKTNSVTAQHPHGVVRAPMHVLACVGELQSTKKHRRRLSMPLVSETLSMHEASAADTLFEVLLPRILTSPDYWLVRNPIALMGDRGAPVVSSRRHSQSMLAPITRLDRSFNMRLTRKKLNASVVRSFRWVQSTPSESVISSLTA